MIFNTTKPRYKKKSYYTNDKSKYKSRIVIRFITCPKFSSDFTLSTEVSQLNDLLFRMYLVSFRIWGLF